MRFATSDGVQLYYERHGDSGAPLIFVHGFTGDITDWQHQIPIFARSHRLLVLDNRGHGQSERHDELTAFGIDRMASDVEELAAHLGFDRYHLLGHSLGGAVAQEIALRDPHRLLSLVLEDTTYSFRAHELRLPDEPPKLSPQRLTQVAARLGRMSPDTLRSCWLGLLAWEGTEARAATIQVPTLVICGAGDSEAIVLGSRRLAELIPQSRLCTIAAAGHAPQEEQPEQFNAALSEFLSTS